jgi:ribosomal protein S18 acetylase RimI-like enzyme
MLEAYELAVDAFTSTAVERASEPDAFWVERITNLDSTIVFGALENDRLVGVAALEFSKREKVRHKAHLIGMYVKPTIRGAGAGHALMEAVLGYARGDSELRSLVLTVTEGNLAAIALYHKAGFKAFGTEPLAIRTHDGFKAKIHMSLDLRIS